MTAPLRGERDRRLGLAPRRSRQGRPVALQKPSKRPPWYTTKLASQASAVM